MKKNSTWLITAKTNLHVGDENTSSYGTIIDKSIQRDALTGLPCINSSSLKGALNEFFVDFVERERETEIDLKKIFGSDKSKNGKDGDFTKGSYAFFDANLLFLPVQGKDELFYWATCDAILNRYRERLSQFGVECLLNTEELIIELKALLGRDKIRVERFSEKDFKELCNNENLPIIARNRLSNGESTNLWYEQILPQETVFYTMFLSNDRLIENTLKEQIVQIGANATIGYGYCKFQEFEIATTKTLEHKELLTRAKTALENTKRGIVSNDTDIESSYNSQTASLAVTIAMSGLKPALTMYLQKTEGCDRSKILDIIALMREYEDTDEDENKRPGRRMYKDVLNCTSVQLKEHQQQILDCVIALKQVIRTYRLTKS